MKCPLLRRYHERYRQSLTVKRENMLLRTILSRAIEGIEINPIRWSMRDINQSPAKISRPRSQRDTYHPGGDVTAVCCSYLCPHVPYNSARPFLHQ